MPAPFPTGQVAVVVPPELPRIPDLIRSAEAPLARELGARPMVVDADPGTGSRWLIRIGGAEPRHHLDRSKRLLVTEAPTRDGLLEAFSTLRDLGGLPDGTHPVRCCADIDELIERVRSAVRDSWPSFALRGVDWDAVCARHAPRVRAAADPMRAVQHWVAELGDAHTRVRRAEPSGSLRYAVRLDDSAATLWEVPEDSAAWDAGVRPGWRLQVEDAAEVLRSAGASAHARPWVAGQALLRGRVGETRTLTARRPGGAAVTWTEVVPGPFDPPWLTVSETPTGAPVLRIAVWAPEAEPILDRALQTVPGDRLVVDLRGNGGGNLHMAWRFRDRFLPERMRVGHLRYSLPGGQLGTWEALWGEPPATGRFAGRVRFITDERTYSASEDALLGLQGLDHVRVVGRRSGGGSGRMRRVRLLPGWVLTISTALTRDRRQRVVEGQGIWVDERVAWSDPRTADPALAAADTW